MSEIGLQTTSLMGLLIQYFNFLFGMFSYLKVAISLVTPPQGIELFRAFINVFRLKTRAVYIFSLWCEGKQDKPWLSFGLLSTHNSTSNGIYKTILCTCFMSKIIFPLNSYPGHVS